MHNFGFKIVDKDPHLIAPILDYAAAHERPLEVGLYFGDAEARELIARMLAGASVPVSAHTDHGRFHAFNLDTTLDQLEDHIQAARALGSRYSVLHASLLPMTTRRGRQPALRGRLLDNLERAEALCEKLDYRLHLENVFHSLPFYRDLFDGVLGRGLRRIHFCFDIGHAKIWSEDTLEDWLDFMDELVDADLALHCHLHANRGFHDEHLAMAEVDALGIGQADGYYNPYGYPGAFWVIEQRFPEAVKVFEVKPELALANLETVAAGCPYPALEPAER